MDHTSRLRQEAALGDCQGVGEAASGAPGAKYSDLRGAALRLWDGEIFLYNDGFMRRAGRNGWRA
jgi:hypothetical protein